MREDSDGEVHIRGPTIYFKDGTARITPLCGMKATSMQEVESIINLGLSNRTIGSNDIHEQSSRSHAILEFEIVSDELIALRNQLLDRLSECVPVDKQLTDADISFSLNYMSDLMRKNEPET